MKNWSVDEAGYQKRDPQGYERWRLEQLINYGLSEKEKISLAKLRAHWDHLNLDSARRRFMQLLLTGHADLN